MNKGNMKACVIGRIAIRFQIYFVLFICGWGTVAQNGPPTTSSSETDTLVQSTTLLSVFTPVSFDYLVAGELTKTIQLKLSTEGDYANFSIKSGSHVLLDNVDLPKPGTYEYEILVSFAAIGESSITLFAQGADITIDHLSIGSVSSQGFPDFINVTDQAGIIDEHSLKYAGPTIADIDNDGDYDLVLNNHNDSPSKLYWNNGDGTFTKQAKDLALWKLMDLHGSAAGDYDNDGDLDLLMTLGGGNGANPTPPIFYKNNDGELVRSASDVGITSGARGRSPRWADLDLDGDLDLILVNAHGINGDNGAQHIFYKNKGDGTFDTISVAGLENAPGERLLLTDLNNDNIDDVVMFAPLSLWKGNGDFTFTDVSVDWLSADIRGAGQITAAVDIDIDNDGDLDLYLTRGLGYFAIADNNAMDYDPVAKRADLRTSGSLGTLKFDMTSDEAIVLSQFEFVKRNGYEGGFPIFLGEDKTSNIITEFEDSLTIELSAATGWPASRTENGLYIGYLGDGKWQAESVRNDNIYWSIHMTLINISSFVPVDWTPNNRNVQDILLRNDDLNFVDVSADWNIPVGGNHWGVTRGDFNNDSYEDLFVYRFGYLKSRLSDYMLINTGEGKFNVTTSHQANNMGTSNHGDMGQAFDYDMDGDIDILNGDDEYGLWHMYENTTQASGNHVTVNVGYSPESNVDPISAVVTVVTPNQSISKRVGSAGEAHSQSLLNMVHFGLAEETAITSITVRWRNGEEVVFNNKAVNAIYDTDALDPTSIVVTPVDYDLRVGTEIQMLASVAPANASQDLVWSSSDPSLATIDPTSGIVTGVAIGQDITITAKSTANGLEGSAKIDVVAYFAVSVESIALTPEAAEIVQGDSVLIDAEVLPIEADDKRITWTSSDESIATVDTLGMVRTSGFGSVSITATSVEKPSVSSTASISALEYISPSIAFDDESNYTDVYFETGTSMEVNMTYHAGTGNTVIGSDLGGMKFWLREMNASWGVENDYTALNTEVIGTESGTAKGVISLEGVTPTAELAEGHFYFLWVQFANSQGNKFDKGISTSIDIVPPAAVAVSGVSLNDDAEELAVGETITLSATVSPENATNKNVTWSTSDEAVATVVEGLVTALTPGTAAITVKTVDGDKTADFALTVSAIAVTQVALNETSKSISIDEEFTLSATITPANATDQTLVWSSSDDLIATVVGGVVKGVSSGEAVIMASSHNDIQASCAVTVLGNNILSLAQNLNQKLLIYPSPASEAIHITGISLEDCQVSLFDLMGEQLSIATQRSEDELILNVNSLSDGVYFLRISNGKEMHNRKVIIRK